MSVSTVRTRHWMRMLAAFSVAIVIVTATYVISPQSASALPSFDGEAIVDAVALADTKPIQYNRPGARSADIDDLIDVGTDCSGLAYYAYQQSGITLNNSAYTTNPKGTDGIIRMFDQVAKANAVPGDLVFYGESLLSGGDWTDSNGGKWDVTHVAIYIGDNAIIHTGGVTANAYDAVHRKSPVPDKYGTDIIGYFHIKDIYAQDGLPEYVTGYDFDMAKVNDEYRADTLMFAGEASGSDPDAKSGWWIARDSTTSDVNAAHWESIDDQSALGEYPMQPSTHDLEFGDFTGDGHADVLWMTGSTTGTGEWAGKSGWQVLPMTYGTGQYDTTPPEFGEWRGVLGTSLNTSTHEIEFIDMDGDKDLDALWLDGNTQNGGAWQYFANGLSSQGEYGSFSSSQPLASAWEPRAAMYRSLADMPGAFLDVNGDGGLDLVLNEQGLRSDRWEVAYFDKPTRRLSVPQSYNPSDSAALAQQVVNWREDRGLGVNVSRDDFDGDGHADVVSVDQQGNVSIRFGDTSTDRLGNPVVVITHGALVDQVLTPGDLTGDYIPDVLVVGADRQLTLYPGDGSRGFLTAQTVDTSFEHFDKLVAPGDFIGTPHGDLVGVKGDQLYILEGDGAGGFLTDTAVGPRGSGWRDVDALLPAGDWDGDGIAADIIAVFDGALYVYPADGKGWFGEGAGTKIGHGFEGQWDILASSDLTGDGLPDLVRLWEDGAATVYPKSSGLTFQPAVSRNFPLHGAASFSQAGISSMTRALDSAPWVVPLNETQANGESQLLVVDSAGSMHTWVIGTGGGVEEHYSIIDRSRNWRDYRELLAVGDWDGDGNADLVGRTATGDLHVFAGDGQGSFPGSPTVVGVNWHGFVQLIAPGDYNGDGRPDIIGVDAHHDLHLYLGPQGGGYPVKVANPVGNDWSAYSRIVGSPASGELLAVKSTGWITEWTTPGNEGFPAIGQSFSSDWNGRSFLFGSTDVDRDGLVDLVGVDAAGSVVYQPALPDGTFAAGMTTVTPPTLFVPEPTRLPVVQAVTVGDANGDDRDDVVLLLNSGEIMTRLSPGDSFTGDPVLTDTGVSWGDGLELLAPGDWDADGSRDLLIRDHAGTMLLHRGNGDGTFQSGSVVIGTGWNGFVQVVTPGDYSNNGLPDLIGKLSNGDMYLYEGRGAVNLWPIGRGKIGHGWQGYVKVTGVEGLTGATSENLIARSSTGSTALWTGPSGIAYPSLVGTLDESWPSTLRVVGGADMNGDGHADVVTLTDDGDLAYYLGNGDGTVSADGIVMRFAFAP